MGNKVAGICYIKADDQQFEVTGSVEVPLSTTIREPMESLSGESGNFRESGVAPYVRLTAHNEASLDYEKIANATNLTVVVEAPNGRVYTLTEAYLSGETVVGLDEGTTPYEFRGAKGVWK
jgi:hypothetical protein